MFGNLFNTFSKFMYLFIFCLFKKPDENMNVADCLEDCLILYFALHTGYKHFFAVWWANMVKIINASELLSSVVMDSIS